MYLKNISFLPVEAVCEDTKTVIVFPPQAAKEVSDEDGKWFISRYNDLETVFVEVSSKPEPTNEEIESVEIIELKKDAFICTVCGRDCGSKMALGSHMRTHK